MSEYWVSHKKYFCRYCEIYIADDAPSRRQHETGLRHKGNTERFVRGLYKQGERRKKDLEEEKREMARVEVAANSAFARDVSSGHASVASSSSSRVSQASPSTAASKKPERPTSVWSNYSTAQSLGIIDPDEERMKAEMERRRTQGIVGDWETVAPPPPPLPGDAQAPKEEDSKEGSLRDSLPQKREAEAPLEDEEDGRRFKLRKRTIDAGLGEIWDPGVIPIKLKSKPKGEEAAAPTLDLSKLNHEPDATGVGNCEVKQTSLGEKPRWQSMGWKRATEPAVITSTGTDEEPGEQDKSNGADLSIKKEVDPTSFHSDSSSSRRLENVARLEIKSSNDELVSITPNAKEEEIAAPATPEPTGGFFRKRKVPAAARGRRE